MALSDLQALELALDNARPNIRQRPGWTVDLFEVGGQSVFPLGGVSGGVSTGVIFYLITWNHTRTEAYSAACEVGRFLQVDDDFVEDILKQLENDLFLGTCNRHRICFEGGDMGRATAGRRYGI